MPTDMNSNMKNVDQEFRFRFGRNWKNYLSRYSEERLALAIESLKDMLEIDTLKGKDFIDVGCGSGVFSLAALKLGAERVVSFDYDRDSVECAQFLNEKYGPFDNWQIEKASILDKEWVGSLGQYDVVYSWGVLHHTGDMWSALDNVSILVKPQGSLFISIYNDQFLISRAWLKVKYLYNILPAPLQFVFGNLYFALTAVRQLITDVINLRSPMMRYKGTNARGMNSYYDAIDWVGGYPFEVATPAEIFEFYKIKRYVLTRLHTRNGRGCNEFVFRNSSNLDMYN